MKKEYKLGNQTVEMDPQDPVFVLGVLYGLRHAREMLEIHKIEQGEKPNPLAVLVNDTLDDLNNKLEGGEQVLKISRKDLPAIFDKMLVSLFNGGKNADKNENK